MARKNRNRLQMQRSPITHPSRRDPAAGGGPSPWKPFTAAMTAAYTRRIFINTAVAKKVKKQYRLSKSMLHELSKFVSGYMLVDERSANALIRRGFVREHDGIPQYTLTPRGRAVCKNLFAYQDLPPVDERKYPAGSD